MRILPEHGDDVDFVNAVERVVNGLIRRDVPPSLILIKIDNWFGFKWLRFSGTGINGWIPFWKPTLTVPPFVPNRVLSQRRFATPSYDEIDRGDPIHLDIPSRLALRRKISECAPGAALVWFSGNSKEAGSGSVMAYVPQGDVYCSWYAGLAKGQSWKIVKTVGGIRPRGLLKLMEAGSTTSTTGELIRNETHRPGGTAP